jgi:ADP-L-glycero-D-manno-heptose 6-epimerase
MILLTGHKGFIGSNLLKRFDIDNVIVTDIDDCYQVLNLTNWHNIEHIYHMGAISNTTETDIERINTFNVYYSIELFKNAIRYNIPVTYASSASVYGNSFTYAVNPLNYYSMSKATIDLFVQDNIDNFKYVNGLRFFNVYGNGEDHKGTQASPIHQFTQQAKNKVIKVFEGSERFIRDFVAVDDVVDCIMTKKESGIYDVGTGDPISFLDVARAVAEKYSAEIETIPFPNHLKNKYQYYTCARQHYNKKFMSVTDYLKSQ